jgi:sulfur carrier protein ThiS
MKNQVELVKLHNPFDVTQKKRELMKHTGGPLLDYVSELKGAPVAISVLGEFVPEERWETYAVPDGAEIVMRVTLGKSFLRLVLFAAVLVASLLSRVRWF